MFLGVRELHWYGRLNKRLGCQAIIDRSTGVHLAHQILERQQDYMSHSESVYEE